MEPKDVAASVDVRTSVEAAISLDRHAPRLHERTILVVEDEAQIRELLSTALRRAGYRVLTATDGEDGWARFDECHTNGKKIDLLVADVVMPRLGGVALSEKILAVSPATKVFFISGYRDRTTPAGAVVLDKPFGYDSLLREVREAFGGSTPLP